MQPTVSLGMWVSLPNEVRYKIRSVFDIPRSSNVMVYDGIIETDGTTYEDIKALTTEKMQKYLGDSSTDFHKLFDKVVARVTEEMLTPGVIVQGDNEPITVIIEPKRRGRPKKNETQK